VCSSDLFDSFAYFISHHTNYHEIGGDEVEFPPGAR
jgi:hypothetical protein